MATVPLEELFGLQTPAEPSLSPDRKHVVYTLPVKYKTGEHETASLWIAEVGKARSARQLTSGLFNDRSAKFSPNGHDIAFVSDRGKAGAASSIHTISTRGGEPYPLTHPLHERNISQFEWSPDGNFIAFLSADEKTSEEKRREEDKDDAVVYGQNWQYARLRLFHVKTRSIHALVKADHHIMTFSWRPDGKEIVYISTRNSDIDSAGAYGVDFHILRVIDGIVTDALHFPGRSQVPPAWLEDDRILFIAGMTITANNTSQCVYQLDFRNRIWTRRAHGEVDDVQTIVAAKDAVAMYKVEEGLFNYLELSSGEVCSEKNGYISSFDTISGGNSVVSAIVSSINCAPPELYAVTYARSSKSLTTLQLSNHTVGFEKKYKPTVTPFYCSASDGQQLDAVYIKPEHSKDERPSLPTVVLVHGGPYHRSPLTFDITLHAWTEALVFHGYAVLHPNYRGGSGHGDAFAIQALGDMGKIDYSDIIDTLRAAIDKGLVHPEKVVIGGWSQGGFLSYLAVTRTDFKFRGAICGAGVSDWDMMSMTSDLPHLEAELAIVAPWNTRQDDTCARHGSAVWHMHERRNDSEKTPVLILHGEEDKRVPITQAIAFHRACLSMYWPCQFVAYPREGHFFKERKHVMDMANRIVKFVDSHIG